jgi:hypothetical protein
MLRIRAGRSVVTLCLASYSALFLAAARVRAEPLSEVLAPEPSQVADEPELPAETQRAYRHVMEQGLAAFGTGHWVEARALFRHGHDLLPNARSFRVLGMTAFNLALYPAALRELVAALSDARRPLSGALREQTEQLRARAEEFVGRFRVSLEPSDAQLRVDGLVTQLEDDGTLLLAVGERQLEVEAPGYAPFARPLLVDGRDDGLLILRLRPLNLAVTPITMVPPVAPATVDPMLARTESQRDLSDRVFSDYRATWSLAASSLALGAVTGVVYASARDEARAVEERCSSGTCQEWQGVTDRRDRLEYATLGLLVGSLVFAVTTGVIAIVERGRAAKRATNARRVPLAKPF